ncbi:unnamed protein product [Polarella glacialis]|uniref:Uncharacterized protein n=1 Tax=Polarella glacialis TaxID=89957 RepID=A0A813DCS7_POLGL|nr:unnamed protein product [Polarella glacialis]
MAAAGRGRGLRVFRQGTDLRGYVALGHSTVQHVDGEGNLQKYHRPRRPTARMTPAAAPDDSEVTAGEVEADPEELEEDEVETAAESEEMMERALEIVRTLRSFTVRAPAGMPCAGSVVNFDLAVRFVRRHARMLRQRGPELALPRVTYHWTAEENFNSIIEQNLLVPDGETVKKKHGAALGRGVYTCPDFRFAQEDFSYGAPACFVCLVLLGRQEERHVRDKAKYSAKAQGVDSGFDSITGRLPGRYVDTWVLPDSDLLLPCFLVDELALREALIAITAVVRVFKSVALSPNLASAGLDAHAVCLDAGAETRPPQEGDENESSQSRRKRWQRAGPEMASGGASPVEATSVGSSSSSCGQTQKRWQLRSRALAPAVESQPRNWGELETRAGDLLAASEDCLLHQCCCVLRKPAEGVAAAIFAFFPEADVYLQRRDRGRPIDSPGTVSVHGRVVNLYGQICPGRPMTDLTEVIRSPYAACFVQLPPGTCDSSEERLSWFTRGLAALPLALPSEVTSLAVPARIGCGLARGNWPTYLQVLRRFAAQHPSFRVVLYDIDLV